MDDRELLERAAKAAGLWDARNNCMDIPWNPLADDGEAMRLAVKLRLDIEWTDEDTVFCNGVHQLTEWHNGDANAATRRAVVRAAASLHQPEGGKTQ